MTPLLLTPADVLLFRKGHPLAAGQHRAAAPGWPFPSTVHEAIRHSLLCMHGRETSGKQLAGRNGKAFASAAYPSLRLRGPLPWHPEHGHLFPIPLDASRTPDGIRRHRLLELPPGAMNQAPDSFTPPCLPAPQEPPTQVSVLQGWWTARQLEQYLAGNARFDPKPVPTSDLWTEEARPGIALSPEPETDPDGELFSGAYLRLHPGVRLAIEAGLAQPAESEAGEFDAWLSRGQMLLGGDRRLVHFDRENAAWPDFERPEPAPWDGPFHVRWVLLTPAIFKHGSLPGWCRSSNEKHAFPDGQVCLRESKHRPFLRAHLIAHHLGAPLPVGGWDAVEGRPKPTRLAVPAGSVYHFLCVDLPTAGRLVNLLHNRHRSDFFGEKGCGQGLCSKPELIPAGLRPLAARLFSGKAET